MVSRALLQKVCEKQGAACCDEAAFLRVLINVNFKPAVVFCNGVEVQCARGESAISYSGWADLFGWTRGRTRRFFNNCFRMGLIEREAGLTALRAAWTGGFTWPCDPLPE